MIFNICFSSSNIYFPFCMAAIDSMLVNNPELAKGNTSIYLLSNEISKENIEKLRSLLDAYNVGLHVVDVTPLKKRVEQLNLKLEFNVSSVLRLFVAELLPDIDKVLFIDTDTYIQHGIADLYNVDVSNAPCAMVLDQPVYKKFLEESDLAPDSPYYNAGVMLINLDYWRKHDVQNQLIECYRKKGHFSVDDQGALNAVLALSVVRLPYKYNAMKPIFSWSYKRFCRANLPIGFATPEEFYEAKNHPVIVHLHGPIMRPWEKWCGRPYTRAFRKHLFKHFPDFKLWEPKGEKWFLFKRYIWNRFLCPVVQFIEK